MERARYVLAALLVLGMPPALAFWFVVHPFVGFWRRVGPGVMLGGFFASYLLYMVALWPLRDLFLIRDLGFDPRLLALAIPLFLLSVVVQVRRKKHLSWRILTGVPEVSGEAGGGELLTEGIYGVIRHPRYLELVVGLAAWCLLLNYLGLYVILGLTVVLLPPIVRLEERELAQRFGAAYADYRRRVPAFVPRRLIDLVRGPAGS